MSTESDPVQDCIGNMGIWQGSISMFVTLIKFPVAWNLMGIIFIAPKMSYFCVGEDGANNDIDPCSDKCDKIEFNRTVFSKTIQTEFDLYCDRETFITLSQSIVMFGVLVGSFIFGYLSDNFGRYKPFCFAILFQFIVSFLVAISPNLWVFLLLRFLLGALSSGSMLIGWVIILEIIGKQYRELFTVLFYIPFNIGLCFMPLFSYYFRNWRHFTIAYTIPTVVLLLYFWAIPESPRWLISKNKVDKAVKIMEKGAKWNKLPTERIRGELELAANKFKTSDQEKKIYGFTSLLINKRMRFKTFALWANWFTVGCGFYGILQFIGQSKSSTSIFINVFITNIIQIPGSIICIFMLRFLGRKLTTLIANIATAVSLFIYAFISVDYTVLRSALAIIGLSGMNILFPAIYLYTGEVCPTVIRNIGLGTSSTISRVGGILAPFIISLEKTSIILPPLIFGLIALLSGLTVFWLPETVNKPLPETLEDGENT